MMYLDFKHKNRRGGSCRLWRADFYRSQNFENGIVKKYVTFDEESKYDIYFDIKTVLTRGVSI